MQKARVFAPTMWCKNLCFCTKYLHLSGTKTLVFAPLFCTNLVQKLRFLHQVVQIPVQIAPLFAPLFAPKVVQKPLWCKNSGWFWGGKIRGFWGGFGLRRLWSPGGVLGIGAVFWIVWWAGRFARTASSLQFALKFVWFASSPRCYPISLSFLSLFFWKRARKTTKKTRIFDSYQTPKIPWKEEKNGQEKTRKSSQGKKTRKSKRTRKERTGFLKGRFANKRLFRSLNRFARIGPLRFCTIRHETITQLTRKTSDRVTVY